MVDRRPVADRPDQVEVWLLADDEVDQFVKGYVDRERRRGRPPAERPGARLARPARGRGPPRGRSSTRTSSPAATRASRSMAGIYGALWGSAYLMLVTLVLCVPIGDRGGGLSRGVRAEEPADRPDRGQHQQPRGRALDRLRPARARGLPQRLRPAALVAPGRRHDAGADGAADDRRRDPRGAARGAAVDPRRRRWARRLASCRRWRTTCCRWRCRAS